MQTVALSTMMAEYYALSAALKEVLPLIETFKAVSDGFGLVRTCDIEFRTTCWEDNAGAWTLANLEPGHHTVRSKSYDVRVHWFRAHLHAPGSRMTVEKVDTKDNFDLYTKPLVAETFLRLRKKLMGW